MFSNLRQGSQLYVFHKCASTPYIEMGSVEMQNQFGSFYQPMGLPMNINIRIGDKVTPCPNLPPNAEIADVTNNQTGEVITLACTKEVLNAEIQNMRQKSVDAISVNTIEYHKHRITALDTLLNQLNPEVAEKAAQAQEINTLKTQVTELTSNVSELLRANKELMAQLKGEGTSSIPKEKKGDK